MRSALVICLLFMLAVPFFLSTRRAEISKFHDTSAPEKSLYSSNPPPGRTGAPGESNCATTCHLGTTQSAAGVIQIVFSGTGQEYIVNENYSFTISITNGIKNGFEATILDANDEKAGTFTSGTNYSVVTSSGRQYVRHSASSGIMSWTFNWTAPASDLGDLTLYFAFNKSNNNSASTGDVIYLGQYTIQSALFNTVTEYEKTDEKIRIWYSAVENALNFDYRLTEPSEVLFTVQDLSGKLLAQQYMGEIQPGKYIDVLFLPEKPEAGIYVVSLFVNNHVFNRKIWIE